eukprot:snap_masked-scaffold_34-processed-gene-3.50-mRNA-1 protein AED:1.00 eAED:1.00 QI:0/0/0/0/1/1/3/0/1642
MCDKKGVRDPNKPFYFQLAYISKTNNSLFPSVKTVGFQKLNRNSSSIEFLIKNHSQKNPFFESKVTLCYLYGSYPLLSETDECEQWRFDGTVEPLESSSIILSAPLRSLSQMIASSELMTGENSASNRSELKIDERALFQERADIIMHELQQQREIVRKFGNFVDKDLEKKVAENAGSFRVTPSRVELLEAGEIWERVEWVKKKEEWNPPKRLPLFEKNFAAKRVKHMDKRHIVTISSLEDLNLVEKKFKHIISGLKSGEKWVDTSFGPKPDDPTGLFSFYRSGNFKHPYPSPDDCIWVRPRYRRGVAAHTSGKAVDISLSGDKSFFASDASDSSFKETSWDSRPRAAQKPSIARLKVKNRSSLQSSFESFNGSAFGHPNRTSTETSEPISFTQDSSWNEYTKKKYSVESDDLSCNRKKNFNSEGILGSFCENGTMFLDGGESGDCVQGKLGNCWFIGALAVLATREDLLQKVVYGINNKEMVSKMVEHGIWVIRFKKDFSWKFVFIDDKLPVFRNTLFPVFGRCRDKNELWVPLMEKAFAKLHGSYDSLICGFLDTALHDLTGYPSAIVSLDKKPLSDFGDKKLFEHLNKLLNSWGSLIGCSIHGSVEDKELYGLVQKHAYSLTDIARLDTGAYIVRIRNPWGFGEWKGKYSDESSLFRTHEGLLRKAFSSQKENRKKDVEHFEKNENDGAFFMELSDFRNYFSHLFINYVYPEGFTSQEIQLSARSNHTFEINARGVSKGQIYICAKQKDIREKYGALQYTKLVPIKVFERGKDSANFLKHLSFFASFSSSKIRFTVQVLPSSEGKLAKIFLTVFGADKFRIRKCKDTSSDKLSERLQNQPSVQSDSGDNDLAVPSTNSCLNLQDLKLSKLREGIQVSKTIGKKQLIENQIMIVKWLEALSTLQISKGQNEEGNCSSKIISMGAGDEFLAIQPWKGQICQSDNIPVPSLKISGSIVARWIYGFTIPSTRHSLQFTSKGELFYLAAQFVVRTRLGSSKCKQKLFQYNGQVNCLDLHDDLLVFSGSIASPLVKEDFDEYTSRKKSKKLRRDMVSIACIDLKRMNKPNFTWIKQKRGISHIRIFFTDATKCVVTVGLDDERTLSLLRVEENSLSFYKSLKGSRQTVECLAGLARFGFLIGGVDFLRVYSIKEHETRGKNVILGRKKSSRGKRTHKTTYFQANGLNSSAEYAVVTEKAGLHCVNLKSRRVESMWSVDSNLDVTCCSNVLFKNQQPFDVFCVINSASKIFVVSVSSGKFIGKLTVGIDLKPQYNWLSDSSLIIGVQYSPSTKVLVMATDEGKLLQSNNVKLKVSSSRDSSTKLIFESNRSSLKYDELITASHSKEEMWGLLVIGEDTPSVITSGDDGRVRQWDVSAKKMISETMLDNRVRSIVHLPRQKLIACGLGGRYGGVEYKGGRQGNNPVRKILGVVILDMKLTTVSFIRTKHDVSFLKFNNNLNFLVVASTNGKLYFFEPTSKRTQDFVKLIRRSGKSSSKVTALDFSPNGKYFRTNDSSYELLFYDCKTGKQITRGKKLQQSGKFDKVTSHCCPFTWETQGIWKKGWDGSDINTMDIFTAHGKQFLAVGDDFAKLRIFPYPCPAPCKPLVAPGHAGHVTSVKWLNERVIISTGGRDNCAIEWVVELFTK